MKKLSIISASVLLVLTLAIAGVYTSCTPDPCKDVVCNNDGTCVDGTCSCATGYEGTDCSTLSRAKVIGVWDVANNSCAGSGGWQVTIGAGSGDLDLTLANFSHLTCLGAGITVNATMTGENTFDIPSQTLCSGNITISGSGTFNSATSMTITYTYNATGVGAGTCSEDYN